MTKLPSLHNDYISILKKCVKLDDTTHAIIYVDALYVFLTLFPHFDIILQFIICSTLGHGGQLTVPLLFHIECVFGKEIFKLPVFITLAAYIGNLQAVQYLWYSHRIKPFKSTMQIIANQQTNVAEFLMCEEMF
jgi:hypothetical protein